MNFKITLKVYLLLCFVLITSSKIIADTKWKQYYSVQVKAYPEYESDKAFGLYEMLKDKNYLLYYFKKKIKNKLWIIIKI